MELGRALVELSGRVLLGHMFLISGFNKLGGYAAVQAHMEQAGLSGALLPLVIVVELGGALLLMFGWQTRWAAFALAGFTVLAAFFFHSDFKDPAQVADWMMHWTVIGGMLVVAAVGPGPFSIDSARRRHHSGGA